MSVQRLTSKDFGLLENPGVKSAQIIWGQNAPDAKVTITRVTMQPAAMQARHSHDNAEQTWLVERGTATLLLANEQTSQMHAGDVIHTPAGDIHGIINTGSQALVYLAITTPPQDFRSAYGVKKNP